MIERRKVTKIKVERQEEKWLEKRRDTEVENRRHKRHFRSGMCAQAEIHTNKKSSDLLIRRFPFVRYCLKYNSMY